MDNYNNEVPQYYQQPEPTWNNDAPAADPGKGFAIASLVTGILSVVCCGSFFIWAVAIILAIVAKVKGSKSGMAIAGLILGIIGFLICVYGVYYNFTHPEQMQEVFEALGLDY